MKHELTLAHSPDSDDLVMWWPLTGMRGPDGELVGGDLGRPAVDTGRFSFRCVGEDVEALNKRAIGCAQGETAHRAVPPGENVHRAVPPGETAHGAVAPYDITAISCHAYPHIKYVYRITSSGGSFGEGYGPKVVVREDSGILSVDDLKSGRSVVAVPGVNTTAFLTLSLMMGEFGDSEGDTTAPTASCGTRIGAAFEFVEMPFEKVVGAVASGKVDAGLLIHEAQLTFEAAGLRAVADVGAWWGERTGLPLSLGLNVVRRDLDVRFGSGSWEEVSQILSASIRYAVEHKEDSRRFLLMHSEGREEWQDDELVERYLKMYVSELTLDMGEVGQRAIRELLLRGAAAGLCPEPGAVDVV